MKKQLLTLALSLCLVLGLSTAATAAESDSIDVIVNASVIDTPTPSQLINGIAYVSYWPIVQALYPNATAVWQDDQAVVTASGLTLTIKPGRNYLEVNGRCLYIPQGVQMFGSVPLVPARILATALGANMAWDPVGCDVVITAGSGPITSGDLFYDANDLYWLSRIIHAESGNQSLAGKIAVGNVVLNRVASSRFPNTVYDVIFQRGQFTPASSGTINRTPSTESIAAAKLCLEGTNTAGSALYFINARVSPNSWAARNRPYVATIGAHTFYA